MSAVVGNYSPRVIGTIFLISFGIYLFLAIVTYTPFDPGWMYVSSDTREVSNASGIAGAWLADLLYGFFGWSALLVPTFLFLEAIQVWWPRSYLTPVFRYAAQFFILLTSSALLYLIWQIPNLSLSSISGGIIGYEMASSLSYLLTSIGAAIFLGLFCFILSTLAFKIEWLKTGQLLRALPNYIHDLFYRNIPENHAAHELTLLAEENAKKNTSTETAPKAIPKSDLQDEKPTTLHVQMKSHNNKEDDENKIAQLNTKKVKSVAATIPSDEVITTKSNTAIDPKTQHVMTNKQQDLAQHEIEEQLHPQEIMLEEPVISKKPQIKQNISEPVAESTRKEELKAADLNAALIAEADRQLQEPTKPRSEVAAKVTEPTASIADDGLLDWSDDQIFDELLAAVPMDQSERSKKIASTAQDPLLDLRFDELFDQNLDQERKVAASAKPELSKEEFIEAWQETAGEPKEFSFDDLKEELDAPLTDASGHPVSRAMQVAEHRKTLSKLPSLSLLDPVDPLKKVNFTAEQLTRLSELLELKLQDFNVKAKVMAAHPGPVVTRFELDLAPGVKASKVTNISRDLARSMSMASVRVVEVIPGKPYIGIEVPNSSREMVRLIELLETPAYRDPNALLSMAMGKDIAGKPVLADLAKAPHMLVAGTTGSGKSVAVNAMLLSMLLKYTPAELRLIMIDPKQLELANYNDIPHLLTPVVTDMKDAVSALNWCVNEMERRYKLMSLLKVRKLSDYNRKIQDALENGDDLFDPTWQPEDSATQSRAPRLAPLPLIVIVADEFADMIMQLGKKAEDMITRLAQKSRAAGIHLLLATQRPTVDVVTGLIKANIPTRAALRVNTKLDSRTILDAGGAEDLLGHGDMLFLGPGKIEPERVHGAFISDDEVNRICDAWRERGSPNYVDEILTPYDEESSSSSANNDDGDVSDRDMLYDQCVAFVLETRKTSASALQRKFSLGYNRAARIIDQMEEHGILSAVGSNGKRDIIV